MATIALAAPSCPAAPACRASWTGKLRLGPLELPVKAYPALVVPSGGPLHQIHRGCGERVSQRKVCPKHGELAAADFGKAFEYTPDDQIALNDEELAGLTPTDDPTIRIEHLVPGAKFEMTLLSGRTLYLAPLHGAGESAYGQAVQFLRRVDTWAVGSMVLSEQRRAVAVRVEQGRLLLFVLHWPEHRRAYPGPEVDAALATPAELRSLEKNLLPLHQSFAWETYHDEAADRLIALIQTKIAARSTAKRPQAKSPTRRARQAA
jgi:DNA end-binding protein Ku